MSEVKSILLAGVGGQGTILVSKLLTAGLVSAGYDVKMSEVHGMAQRGGSVSTQVRYGKQVYSPIIGEGEADILVAFEQMEAVRFSPYLKPGGVAVVNDYAMMPMPVAAGQTTYPQGSIEAMQARFDTLVVPAAAIAQELGNARCMNVVLLGAMVAAFKLNDIDWPQVLRDNLPAKILELNLQALARGIALRGA